MLIRPYANLKVNDWKYLGNFTTKNWYAQKASFAKSRVCGRGQQCILHAACNVARLYDISYVKGVERNKKKHA